MSRDAMGLYTTSIAALTAAGVNLAGAKRVLDVEGHFRTRPAARPRAPEVEPT